MNVIKGLFGKIESKDKRQIEGRDGWFVKIHLLKLAFWTLLMFAAGLSYAVDYLK